MIDNLKPYTMYKDSSALWLGRVPDHWGLRRMKTLVRERSEKGFPDEPLLAATQTKGVIRKEQYENRTVLALKDLHLLKLVKRGDFVISLRSFQGGMEYARDQGIISPAYTILYPADHSTHGYLAWLLKSRPYLDNLALNVTGIRQGQNIDYERLSRSILPLPCPDEQTAIVRFLDHADRGIRRYIAAKKKLIALLNEQKQAIINSAVTRGLDPNVRLKPSGVEWLGNMPEHWDVLRSKYLFREVDSRYVSGEETHLSMSQKHGLIPSSQIEEHRLLSESYTGGKLCESGDLVLNRLKAHLGVFALAARQGIVSPDYTVFRAIRPMEPRYFELVLRTPTCRIELRRRAKGIVQGFWRLYTDDFYDIRVPVPPVSEQARIMGELDDALAATDAAVAGAEREIALVREYRTRLIADVVTGKLDVREAAARLPEEAEEPELEDAGDELSESQGEDLDQEAAMEEVMA